MLLRALGLAAAVLAVATDASAGLKVALIPPVDRGDVVAAVGALAGEFGFQVTQLSPEELVDPRIFNARRFDAAVYTGLERYVYEVKRPGDGAEALLRYLGEGGTLIVAGGCWPFYRPVRWTGKDYERYEGALPAYGGPRDHWLEEQMKRLRQTPRGAFNRFLGLNIAGEGTVQFEKPPADDPIVFKVSEAGRRLFPHLPAQFDFPSTGDLRFRPASGRNLGEGVRYSAVATAVGKSGKIYGDGICVIEHTKGRLAGGAVVYIWGTLLQGQLGEAIIIDALRIAAGRAGLGTPALASAAADLLAQARAALEDAARIRRCPEASYFKRRAAMLVRIAERARIAADLGSASEAQATLADLRATLSLLKRRLAAAQQ